MLEYRPKKVKGVRLYRSYTLLPGLPVYLTKGRCALSQGRRNGFKFVFIEYTGELTADHYAPPFMTSIFNSVLPHPPQSKKER